MTEVAPRQALLHAGIEAINAVVEQLDMNEAHFVIGLLREHLEARAEQTLPDGDDFSDLIGG